MMITKSVSTAAIYLACIFCLFPFCSGQPTLAINKIVNGKGKGKTNIEFQGHSRSIQLTTGQTYSIECKSDDFSNTPWTKNGVGVTVDNSRPNSGSLVYYTDDTADRILVFQNFQSNMVGNYTCTSTSGSRTLQITEGNPIVLMENELNTKSENDAGNLVLKVFVSGNPQPSKANITWYLNNELLTKNLATSKGFDISFTRTSAFITPDNGFQLSMEGNYECHVITSAGTATASHMLDIHSQPLVTLSSDCNCLNNREIIVTINTTFSITCNDTIGDPAPTFTWLKNNIELNNDSVTIQQLSNRVSSLTFTNIQAKQAGRYTCRANNIVGNNHQDVIVNIPVGPQITLITMKALNISIGNDMKLFVIYEGGYPAPIVTWTRHINGIVSNVLNDSRASVSGQHGLNLTLVNVTLEDEVMYVLNVRNGVGSVRLEFNVTILFPPVLTLLSNRVSYHCVGSYVVFRVGISNAQPSVTLNDLVWEGNNIESGQLIISLEDSIAIIMINNLTLSNTGKGRLLVLHEVENRTENFHLTVGIAPQITHITSPTLNVPIGNNMKLLIIYKGGYPDPTVTWTRHIDGSISNVLKDSRASVSGQHGLNLTLVNVTLEDGTVYVLNVENEIDSVQLEFNVTILVPPGHPVNFTLLSVNSTAVIFSWDPPLIGEDITNYTLICYEIINDISYLVDSPFVVDMKGSVNLILNKFRPGTPLNCSLNATNNIGTGYPTFGATITHEQAPGGPPMNFSITNIYSHELTVQWLPPDPFLQYGIIISYTLTCYETESKVVPSSLPRVFPHPPPVNVTVDGLQPFTMYNCTIVANNSAGQSTPASDSGKTVSEGSNSSSTINITISVTSTIVAVIFLTIMIIIIITIVVRIIKRQKLQNKDPVTDKCIASGQVEMLSRQMTQR